MPYLLNIDTATEVASVCISDGASVLAIAENPHQKEHASFINLAIEDIVAKSGLSLKQIDAIAVTNGPGSYTGLRVGLATAKGFCYALHKPLITIGTLEVMAIAAKEYAAEHHLADIKQYCPMIDARRMEVFTAIYNAEHHPVLAPTAMIIDENGFNEYLTEHKTLFFGSGSEKLKNLVSSEKAVFADVTFNASHLANLAFKAYEEKVFADVAYAQPAYHKEFYSPLSITKY